MTQFMNGRGWRGKTGAQRGGIIFNLMFLGFVVLLCAVIYFARRPLLRFAGESWVVDEPVQHADTLVVLSDDNYYADRATRAADLYRHGVAPVVVASGRRLRPYAGIVELMKHDLTERGVPPDKIIEMPQLAANTKEEALDVLKLVQEKKWRNIVVVTSNYHTRRARYIYHRIFPPEITVSVMSARDSDFDPDHWWETRIGVKRFAEEVVGMIVSMWELRSYPQPVQQQFVATRWPGTPQQIVSGIRKHPRFAATYSALQPLSPVISSRC